MMSGGSLNYAYCKIETIIEDMERLAETPLHHAFIAHMRKVQEALHDLEWVWSYDYREGAEVYAIEEVFKHN